MSLAFLPLADDSWQLPSMRLAVAVAFSASGILVFQLRLTELTSPLTVSVLSVFHDVAIVLFFVWAGNEQLNTAQAAGFAVSAVGAVFFACAKQRYSALATEDGTSSISSSIEQNFEMDNS
ncbi:unnamed protein product [Polarella glacialis]|uniref:Uncharacterized protein n=1 Tax=Polarella glacialis TaxID=89957 RepID=A0A813E739_POLGL|nr:unnamed protein product [Polarella glacialis]